VLRKREGGGQSTRKTSLASRDVRWKKKKAVEKENLVSYSKSILEGEEV